MRISAAEARRLAARGALVLDADRNYARLLREG